MHDTPHLSALRWLCERSSSRQTCHVSHAIGFDRKHGTSATIKARKILQTLERRGMVTGDRGRLTNAIFWEPTIAGRALIATLKTGVTTSE